MVIGSMRRRGALSESARSTSARPPSAGFRRAVAALFALATVTLGSVAAACPVCARDEPGDLRWYALGVFIVSPWIVAGAIALYIRKGMAAERSSLPLPSENIE